MKKYNSIGKEEIFAANKVLKSGVLSEFIAKPGDYFLGGRNVKKFEKIACKIFKVKYAFRQIVINDKSVDIRDRIALFRESIISTRFNFTNNLNNFMRNFTYKVDSENLKKIIINDQSKNIDLASRSVEYNKSKEYNAFSLKFCTKKFFMSKLSISK